MLKQINEKRASAIAAMNEAIQTARAVQAKPSFMSSAPLFQGIEIKGPDAKAVIADAAGERTSLLLQGDAQGQGARNATDEAQRAKLQAAAAAVEAAKRQQALIVQQWRQALDENKADNDMTVAQEAQFWVQRMEFSRKGSQSYLAALDEANKGIARMRAENMRGRAEFDKISAQSYLPGDLSRGDTGEMQKQGQAAVEYLRNLNEGIRLQNANADAIARASIQMEEMTGRMSRLNAAQALAALHAKEYKEATDALAEALEHAQSLPAGLERDQRIAGLENQGTQMAGQRQVQVMQDQQNISGNTASGATRDALNRMVQQWGDMTQSILQVMSKTMDGFNDQIVNAITGKKTDFGKVFSEAGSGLLKTALQGGEAKLMGAFGLGKPDGSQRNPIWTRDASGGGSTGGGAVGGAAAPFLGGLMGKIGPFIQPFIPHFAAGGDVLPNYPSMVGERGPEMWIPRSAGTIIPNHQLGGGGDTHVYHIDARGANDPAAIHAAVARALPHAVAASAHTEHQRRIRTPHGR